METILVDSRISVIELFIKNGRKIDKSQKTEKFDELLTRLENFNELLRNDPKYLDVGQVIARLLETFGYFNSNYKELIDNPTVEFYNKVIGALYTLIIDALDKVDNDEERNKITVTMSIDKCDKMINNVVGSEINIINKIIERLKKERDDNIAKKTETILQILNILMQLNFKEKIGKQILSNYKIGALTMNKKKLKLNQLYRLSIIIAMDLDKNKKSLDDFKNEYNIPDKIINEASNLADELKRLPDLANAIDDPELLKELESDKSQKKEE